MPSIGCRPNWRTSRHVVASRWPTRSNGPASSATSPRTATTTPPRTSRATWRAASASSRTCSSNAEIVAPPEHGVVGPGSIVTVVYEGDDESAAERYLVGHIEEKRDDDLDVGQPGVAARPGADRRPQRRVGRPTRRPTASCMCRCSKPRRPERRVEPSRSRSVTAPSRPLARSTVDLPAGRVVAPRARRTAGRSDRRPAPRARRHGRHQLLPLLRGPRRAVPRAGVRPSRPRGRASAAADRSGSSDCADDVAAMADIVGVDRFVPVGYSMGGAVAQLVWRRHRRRVGGLVLCATASQFNGTRDRADQLPRPRRAGRAGPPDAARRRARTIAARYRRDRHADWAPGHVEQTARYGLAGGARGGRRARQVPVRSVAHRDRRPGVGGHDDAPTRSVPVARQRRLSECSTTSVVFPVDGGPRRRGVGAAVPRHARRGDRLRRS